MLCSVKLENITLFDDAKSIQVVTTITNDAVDIQPNSDLKVFPIQLISRIESDSVLDDDKVVKIENETQQSTAKTINKANYNGGNIIIIHNAL